MVDTPTILEIRDVVKDFEGVRALDHCSLQVMQGPITGLIGPNGAGKTTLFNVVTGFLGCNSGQIHFNGERVDGLAPHEVFRKGIVRTFQIPRELKRMTVMENLMVVPGGQVGERVWSSWLIPRRVKRQERELEAQALEVLEFLHLAHLRDEYAGNLSTGQKKLLELARTLMAQPKMVLLDEPAAGVNPSLMNDLAENIKKSSIEWGLTFLLIEHNMNLVMALCNPVIVMSEGRCIAEGPPEEVQRDRRVLEAYLGGRGQ